MRMLLNKIKGDKIIWTIVSLLAAKTCLHFFQLQASFLQFSLAYFLCTLTNKLKFLELDTMMIIQIVANYTLTTLVI